MAVIKWEPKASNLTVRLKRCMSPLLAAVPTICCGSFLSTRFEKPVMRNELHRNQVTNTQTTRENLRDAAYHEAGHVVVAQFFGLTIREVEIEEDGSGRANISSAEHLPLGDQIALCVAGIEAQELFNCPIHQHAALGDYLRLRELLAELTEAESYKYRQAGYLRALEILKSRLAEIEALAHQLFNQRRIAA
jgi:hypothetical protein